MANEVEQRKGDVHRHRGGGGAVRTFAVVAGGVVAVVLAFVLVSSVVGFLAGLVWGLVKVVVVVGVLGGLAWMLLRRRH